MLPGTGPRHTHTHARPPPPHGHALPIREEIARLPLPRRSRASRLRYRGPQVSLRSGPPRVSLRYNRYVPKYEHHFYCMLMYLTCLYFGTSGRKYACLAMIRSRQSRVSLRQAGNRVSCVRYIYIYICIYRRPRLPPRKAEVLYPCCVGRVFHAALSAQKQNRPEIAKAIPPKQLEIRNMNMFVPPPAH